MTQHEILDEFYSKVDEDFDEDFIESLKDLILNDNFSKENFIDLIEGVINGKK